MDLKKLAQELGVSQTTVSRALNGYPEVSEKTRKRVIEAANTYGYRPHSAARRLATGQAGAIGFVMTINDDVPTDPLMMEFLAGAGAAAAKAGIDIHIAPTAKEDELETYRRLAGSRQVDSVIISAPAQDDPRIGLCTEIGLPFIVHGRAMQDKIPYPCVDIDNEGGFHEATKLLLNMGHKQIGFLNGPTYLTFAAHREKGVRSALADTGLPEDAVTIHNGAMNEEFSYRSTLQLVEETQISGLLCSSLILAVGAVRALREKGLVIGKDISLIAHDDVFAYLRPDLFSIPLTCTRSPIRNAGYRIAERLSGIKRGQMLSCEHEIWPVDLVVRKSIGAAA
ncbi:MAG: LacI family DNA-binding transcriptional regulator [Pseudomonadota bacterium]